MRGEDICANGEREEGVEQRVDRKGQTTGSSYGVNRKGRTWGEEKVMGPAGARERAREGEERGGVSSRSKD